MNFKELPDPLGRRLRPVMDPIILAVFDRDAVATLPIRFAGAVPTVLAAGVLFHPRIAFLMRLLDVDERIAPAVMNHDRHTAARRTRYRDPSTTHRGDSGEALRHRAPQDVAQERAVGKAGG